MYKVLRPLIKGRGFLYLLGCPFIGRISRDRRVDNLSRFMFDEHQEIEWFEEKRMDSGKIAGPDILGMIPEKCAPVLTTRFLAHLVDILLNRSLAYLDSQLQESSSNLLCSPGILTSHFLDQIGGGLWNTRLTTLRYGDTFPVAFEEVAMPAQHSVGLNDV